MRAMESGTILGLITILIALFLLGTKGQQIAQAAQGFAGAGSTLISTLQGNSVGAAAYG